MGTEFSCVYVKCSSKFSPLSLIPSHLLPRGVWEAVVFACVLQRIVPSPGGEHVYGATESLSGVFGLPPELFCA